MGSTTPQCRDALAMAHAACCLPVSLTPSAPLIWLFRSSSTSGIPSLHLPLSNASGAPFPPHPHGSGSGWFATPFLYDSFIHYFTPVYPDASRLRGLSGGSHRASKTSRGGMSSWQPNKAMPQASRPVGTTRASKAAEGFAQSRTCAGASRGKARASR